ncbi:DUF692 domain-containing protein [Leucothrix pacifica]|uniref:Uncharacterized protein n=1 Tax=Leucothrix pacifica TaxID=1247513 RepID=A0A317C834_9GAMM|nr:DUF692 domain-containing protein [Leucothrix pacifica]PWQ94431.1 hypothetical protein DKW60_16830 [Leucothrix pacifica]
MGQKIMGCGAGLRHAHIEEILKNKPNISWLEALSDNYLREGSVHQEYLFEIASYYPVLLHGVGLSIGAADPLNQNYLSQLKALADRLDPPWVSDHLCWSSVHGLATHDLIPLPYTQSTIHHVASRILDVQDYLGRELVIENVSSYLEYQDSMMPEWEFISEVVEAADCGMLLDVNNVYVSASNHNFSADTYLAAIPAGRVRQLHLGGYDDRGTHLLDTHGYPVSEPVWALFEKALKKLGPVPTLIEWDNNLPTLDVLLAEVEKAKTIMRKVTQ